MLLCTSPYKDLGMYQVYADRRNIKCQLRSYAATVETAPVNVPRQSRAPDILLVERVDFVAFIAMVMNFTAQTTKKSEKIGIIVSAAERFLGL